MEYTFDVFLSWTGADRDLKNDLKAFFQQKEETAAKKTITNIYDSDENCISGEFRKDYIEALSKSKTYIMILSDHVLNDPTVSQKGVFSEVRKEGNYAMDLEAHGQLNVLILNLSSKFINPKIEDFDENDHIGKHFFSIIQGFTKINGQIGEDGLLTQEYKNQLYENIVHLIQARNAGSPVSSQQKPLGIRTNRLPEESLFGRIDKLDEIEKAFSSGKQIVILHGLGGIGKTRLATYFAQRCNADHSLFCPQIIHISERDSQNRGAGNTNYWIDTVQYQDSVIESLKNMSPAEQRNKKINALGELSEHILLVVDNYNDIKSLDLDELLQKLKCKILITTRINIDAFNKDAIAPIDVSCLPEKDAYDMFCERYGDRSIDFESFKRLYDHVKGHTITLCIIAKVMATHKLSVDKFLEKSLTNFQEQIDFQHNETEEITTIYGHLINLFNVSNLSDSARFVLKNLCLLNDGAIEADELKRILKLDTENEIRELLRNGWIEEEYRNDVRFIKIHPIVSELMSLMLKPTSQETQPVLDYLIGDPLFLLLDESSDNSFKNILEKQERFYFAAYRLARSEGILNKMMWNAFERYNHLMLNATDTQEKVADLVPFLPLDDQRTVTSYRDMITIECYPTEYEVLDRYMEELDENSVDYKWVLRALSVTAHLLLPIPKYQKDLERLLDKALAVAMEKKDDFSVINLFSYYAAVGSFHEKLNTLHKYIQSRIKESGRTGVLQFGESVCFSLKNLKVATKAFDLISEPSFFKSIGFSIRHPSLTINSHLLKSRIEKISPEDEFYFYNVFFSSSMQTMIDEMKIDSNAFLNCIINFYKRKKEHGITLSTLTKEITNCISCLNWFSPEKRTEIDMQKIDMQLSEWSLDERLPTFENLSHQHVAAIIHSFTGDYRSALQNYNNLLCIVEELHTRNHVDYAAVLLQLSDIYIAIGQSDDALVCLRYAYEVLKKIAPQSTELGKTCIALLDRRLPKYSYKRVKGIRWKNPISAETYHTYFSTGLECFDPLSDEYITLFGNYIGNLSSRMDTEHLDEYVDMMCDKVIPTVSKLSSSSQITLIGALEDLCFFAINSSLWEQYGKRLADAFGFIKKKSPLSTQRIARIRSTSISAYNAYKKNDNPEAYRLFKKNISLCIRYGTQIGKCLGNFIDLINIVLSNKNIRIDTFFDVFFKNKKKKETIVSLAKRDLAKKRKTKGLTEQAYLKDCIFHHLKIICSSSELTQRMLGRPFRSFHSTESFFYACFKHLITQY